MAKVGILYHKKPIAKMIKLKITFELCDIWRLKNPKIKRFTFWKNHRAGLIQYTWDFFVFRT